MKGDFMKRLKRFVASAIAGVSVLTGAFAFVGCGGKDDPVKPPVDITQTTEEQKQCEATIKKAAEIVAASKKSNNFTVFAADAPMNCAKFDGDKAEFSSFDDTYYYQTYEDGKNYEISKDEDNQWHKAETSASFNKRVSEYLSIFDQQWKFDKAYGSLPITKIPNNWIDDPTPRTIGLKVGVDAITIVDATYKGDGAVYNSEIAELSHVNGTHVTTPTITPTVDPAEKAKEEMAKLNKFLSDAQTFKNFTFTTTLQDGKLYVAEFAGQKAKVTTGNEISYLSQVGDATYSITKGDDGKWHQKTTDTLIDEGLEKSLSMFADVDWGYSLSYNMLVGTAKINGKEQQVGVKFVDANGGELWLVNPERGTSDEFYYRIHNTGKTSFLLPAEIVNDDASANSEDIYDKQGNINLLALAEVFKEVIGNENIKNDLYFEFTDEAVKFYVYEQGVDGQNMLRTYDMISAIWNDVKKAETKTEMLELLSKINRPIRPLAHVYAEYSTTDYSTEQKAQFDAMTKNIFAELNINGLEEKNVKFAFKTPHGKINASASDGYLYSTAWDHYYVVEIDGNLELLKVGVRASTSRNEGEIDNVINHPEYWNINGSPVRTPLQSGNEEFYKGYMQEVILSK